MAPIFFYGYVILALSFCNMVFVRGSAGSFSVFYVALLDEFRWSHGTGASIVSVNSLVYAAACPLAGWAFDRVGPRVLMPVAGCLIGVGLILSAHGGSLIELYLYYGVIVAFGQAGLGFVTHTALISAWFVRRRATAIGVATMGMGLGMLLIVPLAQFLITQWGWRYAFMFLGGLVMAAVIPANALFQRRHPADLGQLPDGAATNVAHPAGGPVSHRSSRYQWNIGSALRSFPFWSVTAGHLALGTGVYIIYTHVVAYLAEQGLDRLLAAFALGLIGFIRVAGTLIWGFVSDRFGRLPAYAVSILITLLGISLLLAARPGIPLWLIYGAAMIYGIGDSASNPTYGAVIGDIFAGKNVGTILGFLEISFGLGMALGSWSGGAIYDVTGSYRWAFILAMAAFSISYAAIRASIAWQRRRASPHAR